MARYAISVAAPTSTNHTARLFRVQIGATLQKQRLLKGLTQAQVADRAALSLKYVGEVERGDANVSIDIIARIADVIGLNQGDLMHPIQEPLSEGVRAMLVDQANDIQQRLGTIVMWLRALDPVLNAPARPRLLPSSDPAIDVRPSRRGKRGNRQ